MDYKEKYEQALERARVDYNNHLEEGYKNYREHLETIFPELAESEDEKILRGLEILVQNAVYPGLITEQESKNYLAYLKKQKDLFKDGVGYYAYDGNTMHFIGAPAMEELTPVEETCKESLHISETCKENPDSFTDEDERIRKEIIEFLQNTLIKRGIKDGKDKAVKWIAYLEKQKEQKPADRFEEAREKYQVEWSEEDENQVIEDIIPILKDVAYQGSFGNPNQETMLGFARRILKSLRPSWKPSEEQIYSLGTVVKGYNECTVGSVGYHLKEMYEQLKKLM